MVPELRSTSGEGDLLVAGRTVVLADDGAATGTTAHTAIREPARRPRCPGDAQAGR
jgi:predicted phosphoribosyltransferase